MSWQRVMLTGFGDVDRLALVEETVLPQPGPGEVRLKVRVTSAAFTDVMIRKGLYPDVKEKPPFTPGYDLVGIVDALGSGAGRFRIGDRVADLTLGLAAQRPCRRLLFDRCDAARPSRLVQGGSVHPVRPARAGQDRAGGGAGPAARRGPRGAPDDRIGRGARQAGAARGAVSVGTRAFVVAWNHPATGAASCPVSSQMRQSSSNRVGPRSSGR